MWETVVSDGRWNYQIAQLTPGGKWYGRKQSKTKGTIVNLGSHVDRGAMVRLLKARVK